MPHRVTREDILVILSGRAQVLIGSERSEAAAGDALVVPPNMPFEICPSRGRSTLGSALLSTGGLQGASGRWRPVRSPVAQ